MYTLIVWITSCVGLDCPIPDYEIRYFEGADAKTKCETALAAWKSIPKNDGTCWKGQIVIDKVGYDE